MPQKETKTTSNKPRPLRPSLVIINSEQFGYNPATYYYCKYLRDRYSITYICWDHGLKKMSLSDVKVVYVKRKRGIGRIFLFLKEVLYQTKSPDTIIFIKYFKVISTITRLLRRNNPLVLDIRTGSVEPSQLLRFIQDTILKIECLFFNNITVISKGLACKLGLEKKSIILPLGAEIISRTTKKFDSLKLLYVGTLFNRNIDKALEGFVRFYFSTDGVKSARFTIIGAGKCDELVQLKRIVNMNNLQEIVKVVGFVPHDQLRPYFDDHNVGLSYVPMTPYFDVQPPTKTFEYLLSGMAVIATATSENRRVINESNGVLTGDSPEAFAEGLVSLTKKMAMFDSNRIRENASQYSWEKITRKLDWYLQKVVLNREWG